MNRKEKEKFDVATGKKQLDQKEIERRQEIEKKEKDLNRKRWFVILGSVVCIILIVIGISSFYSYQEAQKQERALWPPEVEKPTKEEIKEIENEVVCLDTSMGLIKMELYPESAPLTVNNFRRLVNDGTYDNSIFHRVINDFMIQAGQTSLSESDALEQVEMPINVGYRFKDEINPWSLGLTDDNIEAIQSQAKNGPYLYDKKLKSYPVDYGYLCMANAGPNTNGAQFFIVTKKEGAQYLNGIHTVFGKVIEGMDVAEKIQAVETIKEPNPEDPTQQMDKPVKNVIIKRAWIEEKKTE